MLHWTIAVFGEEDYLDYWKKLEPNLLSVTNGWSAAYGMFTKGEVPIVLSYVTSPAYHLEYEKTERYRTAVFQDGHYRQIEFAGILKGTKRIKRAREFIDFMLSEKFQNAIPFDKLDVPGDPAPTASGFFPNCTATKKRSGIESSASQPAKLKMVERMVPDNVAVTHIQS